MSEQDKDKQTEDISNPDPQPTDTSTEQPNEPVFELPDHIGEKVASFSKDKHTPD